MTKQTDFNNIVILPLAKSSHSLLLLLHICNMEPTTSFIMILENIWKWGAYTMVIFCFARLFFAVFLPLFWAFLNSKLSVSKGKLYLDFVLYWSNTRLDDLFSDIYLYGIEEITISAALKKIKISMTLNWEYLYVRYYSEYQLYL